MKFTFSLQLFHRLKYDWSAGILACMSAKREQESSWPELYAASGVAGKDACAPVASANACVRRSRSGQVPIYLAYNDLATATSSVPFTIALASRNTVTSFPPIVKRTRYSFCFTSPR